MDFNEMMKNVQAMTGRVKEAQEEMKKTVVEGTSGGGMVQARMNGLGELVGLDIDKAAIDPEDPDMLSDLVLAAVSDAHKKVDAKRKEGLSQMTGGIDLSSLGIDLGKIM